ncbi:MAG: tRNA-dihydrouridine synthase [Candidatus Peribacteria bacterium]|jgi:tRNA-dihydrouridine synthase|nr:tRNA-dihydrouridine synthase [Candidatus Peribacteria bacterium]
MKCGGGSDLMKDKKKTLSIIQHLSDSLEHLPFSIKVRAGLHEEDKASQFTFLLEATQYCSKISIHGRTLKQLYSGEADREFIQQVKKSVLETEGRTCEIIGNGGITSYAQAKEYQKRYELDGIMIGQATIGNPWIFTPHEPSAEEKLQTILRHLDLSVACDQLFDGKVVVDVDQLEDQVRKNLQKPDFFSHALVEFRKFLFQYVKGMAESREWKTGVLMIGEYGQLRRAIIEFLHR